MTDASDLKAGVVSVLDQAIAERDDLKQQLAEARKRIRELEMELFRCGVILDAGAR